MKSNMHGTSVWKEIDRPDYKITVEERRDGKHLATVWDKTDCLECDRIVWEFETWGGACDKALDLLEEHTK